MSTATPPVESPLRVDELQSFLTRAEPCALLVPLRILRRIIKEDRRIEGLGLQVPHRKTYCLPRERLLAIAQKDELGLAPDAVLPDQVLLLSSPEQTYLDARPRGVALVKFWRLLFHACLDRHFQRLRDGGRLDDRAVQGCIQRVGRAEFAEVRQVLHQDRYLLPPEDDAGVLGEFLAVYLELRWFNRALLACYFPSFEDFDEVERVAAELVDPEGLFHQTRLIGAPDPATIFQFLDGDRDDDDEPPVVKEPVVTSPSPLRFTQFRRLAGVAAGRGNNARAAILHTRSRHAAPTPEDAQAAQAGALEEVERLTARLTTALELHHHEAQEWLHRLPAVLDAAAHGLFPAAARFLFDLQKVCIDHERDLFAADVVGWAVSWFRRPIQRPLPEQREVLLVKHLHAAFSRLGAISMDDDQRRKLSILLRAALHQREERLRQRFRPILEGTFDDVGLVPLNHPERLARRKLIEELLDLVVGRGFFGIGELRDAISRSQLKLADLGGVGEFIWGDAIILLNRRLAERLDGVYRPGEIYMRALQRGSSLAFGTVVGRWLMLYLILPLAAAFGTVVCVNEFWHLGHVTYDWTEYALVVMTDSDLDWGASSIDPSEEDDALLGMAGGSMAASDPPPPHAAREAELIWTVVLAVFFLALMVSPRFRARVVRLLQRAWHGTKFLVVHGPEWVLKQPPVQRFLASRAMVFTQRYLLRALLLTLIVTCFLLTTRLYAWRQLLLDGVVLALSLIVFNTRLWRLIEESSIDWVARNWHWLRTEGLPNFLRSIVWLFKQALDLFERVLYTVDEWLRFRSGQSNSTFYVKAVLGLVWFLATYLIRVIINLFVEPTFNPIKHFPVVTVSAKLMIPVIPLIYVAITSVLETVLDPWSAGILASVMILLFPGIFGFIAWELKENWRLYRANRPKELGPVMVGHHGERMVQFFRPGFHSGTVRKAYAKLRRAARHADGAAFHKQREQLLLAEGAIRHFLERELLLVLEESKGWQGLRVRVGGLLLGTNRVEWELTHPDPRAESAWLAFEQREGWLVARVARAGWLGRLDAGQRVALGNALAGLYKLAGVDLVEEHIRSMLSADVVGYDVRPTELVAWRGQDFAAPLTLPLEQPEKDGVPVELPVPLTRLLYKQQPLTFAAWVQAWENDQAGKLPAQPVLPEVHFLPA